MARHVIVADDLSADHALFIYDVGDTAGGAKLRVVGAVGLRHLVLREIAEQREVEVDAAGENPDGRIRIDADTQDLGICLLEVRVSVSEGDQLVSSAAGEGEDVEGEDDVLQTAEAAERHLVAVTVPEREIGGGITYADRHPDLLCHCSPSVSSINGGRLLPPPAAASCRGQANA